MRQTDLDRATSDLARRERLAASGAVSGEELQHARDARRTARRPHCWSRSSSSQANRARVDRTTVENHPDVLNAAAQVREAYLTLRADRRCRRRSSGFVAKRAVQLGQRVSPGAPLMAIVPLDQVWVDANFKEPQLAAMRVGQPVTLSADLYGGKVVYHGKVAGFGAGTGSAFALLPAQNATGNWIKIVQRVPVRIALDPQELAAHPLQIGLSMEVEVDAHERARRAPAAARADGAGVRDRRVSLGSTRPPTSACRAIIAANERRARRASRGRSPRARSRRRRSSAHPTRTPTARRVATHARARAVTRAAGAGMAADRATERRRRRAGRSAARRRCRR